ncbi:MAG TPA: transposase, partial [Thermoguttaceae bacterium]|nr:transposase [Thermoguttaceae bacterium]
MDEPRCNVWNEIRQHGLRAFGKLLPAAVFGEAAAEAGISLGCSALRLPNLAWLAIASALHNTFSFAAVLTLTLTLRWLMDSEHWSTSNLAKSRRNSQRRARRRGPKRSRHDPRGKDTTVVTEEAFVQARQRIPLKFRLCLLLVLGRRFQVQHDRWLRWNDFRLLALDGSLVDLPNWKALGDHYGRAQNGGGPLHPQARMVMLQFPLARMPWRYELCPFSQGERTVAGRLLIDLALNDLVLMDQGFWSYGLFRQIQNQGAFFAIRLFPQVRSKTLKKLGNKDRLVQWTPSARKWRQAGLPPSIRLRVIDYRIPGFRPSAVVTNVLDPRRISHQQWVHMATENEEGNLRLGQGLYHRRWEIETTFSELKVVQGMER